MKFLTFCLVAALGAHANSLVRKSCAGGISADCLAETAPLALQARSPSVSSLYNGAVDASTALEPRATKIKSKQTAAFKAFKKKIRLAHGVLMGLSFLGVYPLASLMMRLGDFPHKFWIHAGLQILAMAMMYTALGCGIWFATYDDKLYGDYTHGWLGTFVPCLMILQPAFGWLHHRGYIKTGGRNLWTFVHSNYGRILIFLGGVNGIIGRENEAGDYTHGQTIWSTIFAIVTGIYLITWGMTAYTRRRAAKKDEQEHDIVEERIREKTGASSPTTSLP